MAAKYTVREWGVLKLASSYTFPRRRTSNTFAAPPVGESYETEPICQQIYILPGLSAKLPKIVTVSYQLFFITGGQKWRFVIKICTSSIFGENFRSPNIKNLCTADCSRWIQNRQKSCFFAISIHMSIFSFIVVTNFAMFLIIYIIERVISRLLNELRSWKWTFG